MSRPIHSIPSRTKGEKGLPQMGRGLMQNMLMLLTKGGRETLSQAAAKKTRARFKNVNWKPRKQRGGQMGIVQRRRRRRKTTQLGGWIASSLAKPPGYDMVRHLTQRYKSRGTQRGRRKRV